jgi:hypothetical protein
MRIGLISLASFVSIRQEIISSPVMLGVVTSALKISQKTHFNNSTEDSLPEMFWISILEINVL